MGSSVVVRELTASSEGCRVDSKSRQAVTEVPLSEEPNSLLHPGRRG